MKTKNFSKFFENQDMTTREFYSSSVVISVIRSVLEPLLEPNSKGIIFYHLKNTEGIQSTIKRLEYSQNITMREFSDFEFSKFDVDETGFIVLTTKRYNCAFLFREIEENKFEIYLKLNSKLVANVYEAIKSIFLVNFDEEFYEYRPERRENTYMNNAILNIVKKFEETIKENEYNLKIQENYKTVNETNTSFRNEIYQNIRATAHEIKNQLSILDIYVRIFEKKTSDEEITIPIKKSIQLIKSQIENFNNIDVLNLQHINLKDIIQEAMATYSNILKENNNKLVFIDEMAGGSANIFADKEKFLIVMGNIIKNANEFTKNDKIILKLTQLEEKIKLSFINHGAKIETQNKEKIFEQGFTTKSDGWGVGLNLCKKLVGSQFGVLELEKSDEEETIFSLYLPLAQ